MNKLGLYLHVPFCRRKCAYCDFYSVPREELLPGYVKKTLSFLKSFSARAACYETDTVYFGGGTPGLLAPADWTEILGAIREDYRLSGGAEITAEMNPETLAPDAVAAFCAGGGNRLSIGMQSADDALLTAIGRRHGYSDVVRAVRTARREGIGNLSLDLIYALPGQSFSGWRETLEKAVALSPEHLSLYCLTLSDGVPLAARRSEMPDEETQREEYLFAADYLEKQGYLQYEISNFARPGFESRHNLRYWRRSPYLGIGPGAHSFFENERFSMKPDLAAYLAAGDPGELIEDRAAVSPREADEETVMLSLRLAEGLDLSRVADPDLRRRAEEKLKEYARHGLCRKTVRGFSLTPEGFFVSNSVIAELI